jgi:hypothetical protein
MRAAIDLKWLESKGACPEAVAWFKTYDGPKEIEPLAEEMIRLGHLEWLNWGLVRLMTKKQAVEYAIYAAEQVLSIYEDKYPKDDRPRKAIEAAKGYLAGRGTAHTAARAAYAAAYAARAACAAYAAAYAARAAYAAAYAARAACAAYAAAYAARAACAAYAAYAARAARAAYAAAYAARAAYAACAACAAYAARAAASAAEYKTMLERICRRGILILTRW